MAGFVSHPLGVHLLKIVLTLEAAWILASEPNIGLTLEFENENAGGKIRNRRSLGSPTLTSHICDLPKSHVHFKELYELSSNKLRQLP
jgi:hypothetical protein